MIFFVFQYFYCTSSDFSDLPDMTDEYMDLSVSDYNLNSIQLEGQSLVLKIER